MDADSDEVVVVYEYTAQLQDELSLKVGDVITKVERMEGGWWRGDLAGVRGMFPDNFVKVSHYMNTSGTFFGLPRILQNWNVKGYYIVTTETDKIEHKS